MNTISIAWIVLPFVAGFLIFLLPKLDRYLAIFAALGSAGYALQLITSRSSIELLLLDNFGVTLLIDLLNRFGWLGSLRDWLQAMGKIVMAIPIAYIEAIERVWLA